MNWFYTLAKTDGHPKEACRRCGSRGVGIQQKSKLFSMKRLSTFFGPFSAHIHPLNQDTHSKLKSPNRTPYFFRHPLYMKRFLATMNRAIGTTVTTHPTPGQPSAINKNSEPMDISRNCSVKGVLFQSPCWICDNILTLEYPTSLPIRVVQNYTM